MARLKTEELEVVWLQGAGCTGCSVSILNSVSPSIKNVLIDEVVPGKHVNLRFHPTIMAGAGEPALLPVAGDGTTLPGVAETARRTARPVQRKAACG